MTKLEIINYAQEHKLTWHEDSTNAGDTYLRNRIRRKLIGTDDDTKRQLLGLWVEQKSLKKSINKEVGRLVGDGLTYDRYFFINIDSLSGMECLRYIMDARLTRPQLDKALRAIKTILPNKTYHAGSGIRINFTSRNFTIEMIK
jgi:tRNA(Ile)-lysidine synthase TilS/MesJ